MSRRALMGMTALLLLALLLAACGGGSKGGKSLDPESIARKYVEALFAGNADEAKGMALASFDFKDEFLAKTDKVIAVFAQYDGKNVRISTTRGWRGGESGESDKRAEVQFEYRKKGSNAEFETGIIYVRVTASGGLWGITDVVLAFPDK